MTPQTPPPDTQPVPPADAAAGNGGRPRESGPAPAPAPVDRITAAVQSVTLDPASEPVTDNGTWKPWHTIVSLAIVGVMIGFAIWAATSKSFVTAAHGHMPVWTFLGFAALMTAFIVLLGWGITGRPAGAFIDAKKARMSLSRLQVMAWTVLVLSAYINAFVANVAAGRTNPISVAIPGELLVAMGISIGGLVGAQVVLGYKKDKNGTVVREDGGDLLVQRPDAGDDGNRSSAVMRAPSTSWADVFRGDTVQTSNSLDPGKVQMFTSPWY